MKKRVIENIMLVILFLVLFSLCLLNPNLSSNTNAGKLIINEVMAMNKHTIIDENGNYSDYTELYNGYDYDINLLGYTLSDSESNGKKWAFPDVTIKANDYLVVFASGLDKREGELHTNFKLSSKGERVILTNNKGILISKIYYEETLNDTSYGFNGKNYVYFYKGTPGLANESEYEKKPIVSLTSLVKLSITEYLVNNIKELKSNDGNYYSMIEIHNRENKDVNLEGYYLSDSDVQRDKYVFPDVTIKANDYLVLYMSGLNKNDGELHSSFSLNSRSTKLILMDNKFDVVDSVKIEHNDNNYVMGLYKDKWRFYDEGSFGRENTSNYVQNVTKDKSIVINEVSAINPEGIELKNISDNDIDLEGFSIGDKSGAIMKFPKMTIKANSYVTIYGSDSYSYSGGKLYSGFHINNSTEVIYLYKGNSLVDSFEVGKLVSGVSTGLDSNGRKVLYKDVTLGRENSGTSYNGYAMKPVFDNNNIYVDEGDKVKISSLDGSDIYYTTDGSFPTDRSSKYNGEITVNGNMVIKAIAYKEGKVESDVVHRTYLVGREHKLPVISISSDSYSLFDNYQGLLGSYSYKYNNKKKISFEFYETNGDIGTSFTGSTRLTGMDSREREQKSMAIYLNKEYGLKEVTYPFFKDGDYLTYSSFVLRNSGEDPYGIRIFDTALVYALKGQMDIDMQDYRAVVVYLNAKYYGLYNLREKLNGDYIESKYGISKDDFDLIKYDTATVGSTYEYDKLVSYIRTHNPKDADVYNYLKEQIDIEEFCNYMIVESYYGNTDQGNIRYWKKSDGKWRFMLYDLDWSLWNTSVNFSYPVLNTKSPSVTYLYSAYEIGRKLYQNDEFKDLYLKTLAYHLKNTFNPERMNKIVDELEEEIRDEMPYHIERWKSSYPSMSRWENNVNEFKNKLTNRYNYVTSHVKSEFNLSESEYQKYFG